MKYHKGRIVSESVAQPASTTKRADRKYGVAFANMLPYLTFLILTGLVYSLGLAYTGGEFVLALDDPYIHLALAENIATGHYGINPNEVSAPASSIIWPFLIVPFTQIGFTETAVWLFCTATALLTVIILDHFISLVFPNLAIITRALLTTLLILNTNIINLPFLGMEHSLQVATAAAIVLGLAYITLHGALKWWLVVALMLAPLVRYETMAVAFPVWCYLAWRGYWRPMAGVAAGWGLTVGGFSAFLLSNDLAFLPSSVLAKSTAGESSTLGAITTNYLNNTLAADGNLVLLATVLLFGHAILLPAHRGLLLVAGSIGALHLVFGSFATALSRYQSYAVAGVLMMILLTARDPIIDWLGRFKPRQTSFIIIALMLSINIPSITALATTPQWQHIIYHQQYQSHRFVTEYWQGPIAANDIGWVSYQSDYHVLDLWGLASYDALENRQTHDDFEWATDLMRENNVEVALVFDSWITPTPSDWIRVGRFKLKNYDVDMAYVSVYVIDPALVETVRGQLQAMQPTLPDAVEILYDE